LGPIAVEGERTRCHHSTDVQPRGLTIVEGFEQMADFVQSDVEVMALLTECGDVIDSSHFDILDLQC
jgi:hypothetical protein